MRPKALVVDDDTDVRETLAEQLTMHGFEVLTAGNGLEALLQVKRQRPAAVVLDVMMPRLGGLEALRRIRAFHPEAKVVIVSGNLDDEVRQQALALGAAGVLESLSRFRTSWSRSGDRAARSNPGRAAEGGLRDSRAARGAGTEPGRILIVDDDPEIGAMLSDFLTLKGYSARAVPDAATAVREVVAAPPDVVLLDINMPGLSGTDALPTIRAVAPRAVVIMVSATEDAATAKRALAYGAFDYVVKPIDLQYLSRSIETAVLMARPEL